MAVSSGGPPEGQAESNNENRIPGAAGGNRRKSSTGKQSSKDDHASLASIPTPIAPSSFFGPSSSLPTASSYAQKAARPPLESISPNASQRMQVDEVSQYPGTLNRPQFMHAERTVHSPPTEGLDLDADDTIPSVPSSPLPEIISEQPPSYDRASYANSSPGGQGYPDPCKVRIRGCSGQLHNALLGHSTDPEFKLDKAIPSWSPSPLSHDVDPLKESLHIEELWDFDIVKAFVADPLPKQYAAVNATAAKKQTWSQVVATSSPSPQAQSKVPTSAEASSAASPSGAPQSPTLSSAESSSVPFKLTLDQLELAKPHPHAFFNTKTLTWSVVTPLPPLGSSPEQPATLKELAAQLESTPFDSPNDWLGKKTHPHHYVRVLRQVDPKFILRDSDLPESPSHLSQLGGPASEQYPKPWQRDDPSWIRHSTPKEQWWDLYVCSNTRASFTLNPRDAPIKGVLDPATCEAFIIARISGQEGGKALTQAEKDTILNDALEYLWKVLRNLLFNEARASIPISGTTFLKRMGSSAAAVAMFQQCGFTLAQHPHFPDDPSKRVLHAPPSTPTHYLILMRAFLEISIWNARYNLLVANHRKVAYNDQAPPISKTQTASSLISLRPFVDTFTQIVGKDNVPTYQPALKSGTWQAPSTRTHRHHNIAYKVLGVTPDTADSYVVYAYEKQLDVDPKRAPFYLDALKEIAVLRSELSGPGNDLEEKVALESSRDKASWSEVCAAIYEISGSKEQPSTPEIMFGNATPDVPTEEEITALYTQKREQITIDFATSESAKKEEEKKILLRSLKAALELLDNTIYKSDFIKVTLSSISEEENKPAIPIFSENDAYSVLKVGKDVDETTLMLSAQLWLQDPDNTDFQKNRIKGALVAIAKARNSKPISKFVETGELPDEGMPGLIQTVQEPPVAVDRPAGLQNIGNTCYLNSLLQYFFTIKELRDIVLEYQNYQEDGIVEDHSPEKRVGGRRVTKKEIERSKRFVTHLQGLFQQLVFSPTSSVKPEIDLAYLALVSSKDEEEATSPKSESSKTLPTIGDVLTVEPGSQVDESFGEGLALAQPPEEAGSPSVLGKRNSEHLGEERGDKSMDIDNASQQEATSGAVRVDEVDFVMVSREDGTKVTDHKPSEAKLVAKTAADGVVEILPDPDGHSMALDESSQQLTKPEPPPLPPRPTVKKSSTMVNSNMMFGKQNDVSEAMDNVIFQVEVGLDDSKISKSASPGKSFVQSLFYGVSRQTLSFESTEPDSKDAGVLTPERSRDETFSYLLVDVASEGNTLYDGLDASFQPSIVEIEGRKAQRTEVLKELPPILQIQLQRVQFDRKTSRVFKSNAYMPFPLTLRMNRYLAPDPHDAVALEKHRRTQELRTQLTAARKRLAELEQVNEDKQTIPDVLREAEAAIKDLSEPTADGAENLEFSTRLSATLYSDDLNVPDALGKMAQHLTEEVSNVKREIEATRTLLEQVWEDDHNAEYELSSVFIHLGAAGYGHYYLYQRALPHQPDRWLKFNDSSVTDVDVSEVFADTTGSTANPYWLSYVRTSEIPRRIDAICRNF